MLLRPMLAVFGMATVVLFAGDVWKKDAQELNQRDRQKLLTHSPWAKDAETAFGLDGPGGGPPGGGPPDGPGGGPPGGPGGPFGEMRTTVRWESALPMRLAQKKTDAPMPGQYIVSITGLPMLQPHEEGHGNTIPAAAQMRIKQATRLLRKGKDPMPVSLMEIVEGESPALVFTFEGDQDPIAPSDREVVFVSTVGALEVRARFVPKEMIYQGKPAF